MSTSERALELAWKIEAAGKAEDCHAVIWSCRVIGALLAISQHAGGEERLKAMISAIRATLDAIEDGPLA